MAAVEYTEYTFGDISVVFIQLFCPWYQIIHFVGQGIHLNTHKYCMYYINPYLGSFVVI